VLCDETAIIGVMKQNNKITGELKETIIKFGKEALTDNMFAHHQPQMKMRLYACSTVTIGHKSARRRLTASPLMNIPMAPPQAAPAMMF